METIYQKIGAVNKEVSAIDKTRKNEQQGFMFRGIEDFMNELHNLFAKHGIFIVPSEREHIQEDYDYTDSRGNKKVQFRTRVHMAFKFVSVDDGSFIETDGWGEAADNGDKGYNKCKSIALKYVLMQMFLVPTKDIADPDRETPDEVVGRQEQEDPDLELAIDEIKRAGSLDELNDIARRWGGYMKNARFLDAGVRRRTELMQRR